jgi:hypothetical protein
MTIFGIQHCNINFATMFKHILKGILLPATLFTMACSSPTPEVAVPVNVLSKDSIAAILVDIHLLEAVIDLNLVPGGNDLKNNQKYYPVFKKHNITRQQYDSSMVFYSSNPALLNQIYDNVIAALSRKQAELNKH